MNQVVQEYRLGTGTVLQIVSGDITLEQVDAIVNAANEQLIHGGGLAGAIVRRGGYQIQEESTQWVKNNGSVPHVTPAVTSGGNLPCAYIIHAVGPVWGSGNEETKLKDAVDGALQAADRLELHSIAIPAISTGIFGFPVDRAAHTILKGVIDYFRKSPLSNLKLVRLTLFDQSALNAFLSASEILLSNSYSN